MSLARALTMVAEARPLSGGGRDDGWLRSRTEDRRIVLQAGGRWTIATAANLDRALAGLEVPSGLEGAEIDLSGLQALDTVGAWLLHRTQRRFEQAGLTTRLGAVSPDFAGLLEQMTRVDTGTPVTPSHPLKIVEVAERTGEATISACGEALGLVNFIGVSVVRTARTVLHPARLRLPAVFHHMETTGLNAMPIVGLLAFLIGVVLAYQGATQLQRFGAEILVVDLLGVSILRVLGPVLTAIIIAGRSGSAYTAQIGTMQVSQEVDALRAIGLNPVEVLVLPRVIALLITLPLLSFFASILGLVGGAVTCYLALGIEFNAFAAQLRGSVNISNLWVGMVQTPAFAIAIALVGCHQGLKVTGSAESVGRLTTQSVVVSIFLVIVLAAVFSVVFAEVGI